MDPAIIYNKDEKIEELNEKIADILSEVLYSYIIRKRLLLKRGSYENNELKTTKNLQNLGNNV